MTADACDGLLIRGGERVTAGTVLVRQTGAPLKPGRNVVMAANWSLVATAAGVVVYRGGKVHVDASR